MSACQDTIDFDLEENPNYLVVDGFITDEFGPHIIHLSRSSQFTSALDGGFELREVGASLCIRDNNDNCTDLTEVRPGEYATPDQFRGQPGDSYTLHVTTSDGNSYISGTETLVTPGPIDSVYMDSLIVQNVSRNGVIVDKIGLQFFIDFTFPDRDYYYFWDWESTFILKTYYDGGIPDSCFVDEWPIEYLNILESNTSSQRTIQQHPIVFKDIDFKFSRGFSLNVQQYAVSREAYQFYDKIENQMDATGSIFDPAPTRITGNISNVNSENDIVLGYFGAFGLTEKRTFVDSLVSFIPSMSVCLAAPEHTPPNMCFDCRLYEVGGNFKAISRKEMPEYWE